MPREFTYIAESIEVRGSVEPHYASWGRGLTIRIYKPNGTLQDQVVFMNHPEFDGFDESERLSEDELTLLVIERLNSGIYVEEMRSARKHNAIVYFRINSPSSMPPNKTLERSLR